MAVPTIVPQCAPAASPLDPTFAALADLLTDIHAADPAYGLPFARALRRAVAHVAAGIAYEPFNVTHYRIQSASRAWLWHYVTLHQCSCDAPAPWCWHRALLHLLTARAALASLDRCPRPALAFVPPRAPLDYAAVLREADELF